MRPRHLPWLLGLCLASCTLAHNPDLPSLDESPEGDGDFVGDGDASGSGGSLATGGAPVGVGGGAGGIPDTTIIVGGQMPGGMGGEP